MTFKKVKTHYLKSKQGQGMSEYLILVMLIAAGAITAANSVGKTVIAKLKQIQESLQTVTLESVRGKDG